MGPQAEAVGQNPPDGRPELLGGGRRVVVVLGGRAGQWPLPPLVQGRPLRVTQGVRPAEGTPTTPPVPAPWALGERRVLPLPRQGRLRRRRRRCTVGVRLAAAAAAVVVATDDTTAESGASAAAAATGRVAERVVVGVRAAALAPARVVGVPPVRLPAQALQVRSVVGVRVAARTSSALGGCRRRRRRRRPVAQQRVEQRVGGHLAAPLAPGWGSGAGRSLLQRPRLGFERPLLLGVAGPNVSSIHDPQRVVPPPPTPFPRARARR